MRYNLINPNSVVFKSSYPFWANERHWLGMCWGRTNLFRFEQSLEFVLQVDAFPLSQSKGCSKRLFRGLLEDIFLPTMHYDVHNNKFLRARWTVYVWVSVSISINDFEFVHFMSQTGYFGYLTVFNFYSKVELVCFIIQWRILYSSQVNVKHKSCNEN